MFDLSAIQAALRDDGLHAWLLVDFRGSNVLARRTLDLPADLVVSRRFCYAIPARGEPKKLVHRIEPGVLDHLPGTKIVYLTWQEFEAGLEQLVAGARRVAMEYSPRNAIPYIARVDAGTVDLVRSFGAEVVSSGDLIQRFEATWSDAQWASHLEAATHTDSAYERAWTFIADSARAGRSIDELDVQRVILDHFAENGLITDHPPIVAVGPHSGDPHYETGTGKNTAIADGDFVLIDLWAKLDQPDAVYSDLTRVGYVGDSVPAQFTKVFQIVAAARDAAIERVQRGMQAGETLCGWQVDEAARHVITQAGYGQYFIHRTGHSIGRETHGNGANMDNLETHDERRILPRTCFSVEPGIYLPEFGIRSEVNVFVDAERQVHVTGGARQTAVEAILAGR